MSMLDSLLGQLGGNVDIASIAQQAGIDPSMAQTAVAALGQAHNQDGDTVETASAATGIDSGTLNSVVGALGGTGGLGQVASMLESNPQLLSSLTGMLGGGAEGGAGGLLGMAAGLFGGKE